MRHKSKLDLVYSFYQGLCRHLQTVVPITTGTNKLADVEAWLDAVDTRCEVHQLRTYLLTNDIGPEVLKAVLEHHRERKARASGHDDKLDLLLVHYLAQSISHCDNGVAFSEAAKLLEPVLGLVRVTPPPALLELREELTKTSDVGDLLARQLFQRVHQLRATYKDASPGSVALFAWFALLLRRTCVRLVMADLDCIERNCRLLRSSGATTLRSGVTGNQSSETLESVEAKCNGWRRPFAGKYHDDSWFRDIAACKQVTGDAVRNMENSGSARVADGQPDQAREQSDTEENASGETLIHLITEALQSVRSGDVARVQLRRVAVMLSSAEMRAFRCPDEPTSPLLRDMVVARAKLAAALRSLDPPTIERARAAAEEILRPAQDAIAAMQHAGNPEMSINLISSARALEKAVLQLKAHAFSKSG